MNACCGTNSSALETPDRTPHARLLLLGASNVRRALPELVREARWRLGSPLEVVASHGSGRSYLGPSRLLGRGLDRIAPDAFWRFEEARDAPNFALVADVGNDLAYGSAAAPIASAIRAVVERLTRSSRVVIVGLPLASLRELGPLRFHTVRMLLFPTRRIERARVLAEAEDLDARLRAMATQHGATFVAARSEWYGLDPIHIRIRSRADAASTMLETLGARRAASQHALELGAFSRLKPAEFSWFGTPATWPQPSASLADGTRISWI